MEEKNAGNALFEKRKYEEAIRAYTKGIHILTSSKSDPTTLVALYSNRSQANLESRRYHDCIEDATKALEINPAFKKAYFRRAKANQSLGKNITAIADFNKVLEIAPDDVELAALVEEEMKKLPTELLMKALSGEPLYPEGDSDEDDAEDIRTGPEGFVYDRNKPLKSRRVVLPNGVGLDLQKPPTGAARTREYVNSSESSGNDLWPCIGCKEELSISAFHPLQRPKKDGIPHGYAWCNKCVDPQNPTKWPALGIPEEWADIRELPNLMDWVRDYHEELSVKVQELCPVVARRTKLPITGLHLLNKALERLTTQKSGEGSWHFPIFPSGFNIAPPKPRGRNKDISPDELSAWIKSLPLGQNEEIKNFKSFPHFLSRLMLTMHENRAEKGNIESVLVIFVILRDHVPSESELKKQLKRQFSLDDNWKPTEPCTKCCMVHDGDSCQGVYSRPGWKPNKHLKYQIAKQKEHSLDYLLVPPSGSQDFGCLLTHPKGRQVFTAAKKRANETGNPGEVSLMFEFLQDQGRGMMSPDDIWAQLCKEYSLDKDGRPN